MNENGNRKNGKMMDAWAGNRASDAPNEMTVRNLPASFSAAGYDVYIYFDSKSFGRIPNFYVASELYEPELTAAELAPDRASRDEQLWAEAERMRLQMVRMLEGLRAQD